MNEFESIFHNNSFGKITKWQHYFKIYDRYLSKYRGRKIIILEFGVFQGGSLHMWKEYFGENCTIYGVDINPECKALEMSNEDIHIMIGNQEDRDFLKSIAKKIGHIDIIIDDGGHTMKQQITTFEEMFPCMGDDGVFIIEDLHTSYFYDFEYGGGYKNPKSFIEYSKNFIDFINAWHVPKKSKLKANELTESVNALHYYDSVLVIEKKKRDKSYIVTSGKDIISRYISQEDISLYLRIKRKIYTMLDLY